MAEELTDEALEFAEKMFTLAREGRTELLAAYVDAGLPVDLANHNGDTLLVLAAYHEHPDTVLALLERGADVTRANLRGQNALTSATFKQDVESVRALLAAGADPDAGTPSARATAEYFNLPEMTKLFE
ncbi:MAG: ankyrin repeat domain-containing protein [Actinomycetota bacterium]